MSRGEIDWSKTFTLPLGEYIRDGETDEKIDTLVERATLDFEPLFISDETLARIQEAGCSVRGVRYFNKLFSQEENVTPIDRTHSILIGSVAHGHEEYAAQSYTLLCQPWYELVRIATTLNSKVVSNLNKVIKLERKEGSLSRLNNLEDAAKELGKPYLQRVLGGFASGQALHSHRLSR